MRQVNIEDKNIGDQFPVYIIAEIGLNHNGDLGIAKKLIDVAVIAGCDAVKFQKRDPELCVPDSQKDIIKETPWGNMRYIDYRHIVELDESDYLEISQYCKERGIHWFASCWDVNSVDFMNDLGVSCFKVASATLTNHEVLKRMRATCKPIILSTGMSTMLEITEAVSFLGLENLMIAHTTSAYPCPHDCINLKMITTLREMFTCPVGYSGHEVGLQVTYAAVALGANFVERHITLDRTMWGSDQSASIEPSGLIRLVRDVRIIETALGDGFKRVYDIERSSLEKLRGDENS